MFAFKTVLGVGVSLVFRAACNTAVSWHLVIILVSFYLCFIRLRGVSAVAADGSGSSPPVVGIPPLPPM